MEIKFDGSQSTELPAYAAGVPLSEYATALVYVGSNKKYLLENNPYEVEHLGHTRPLWKALFDEPDLRPQLATMIPRLYQDPSLYTKPGFDFYMQGLFTNLASELADEGDLLKLVLPSDQVLPGIGQYFDRGLIAVEGNVGKIADLSGGSIFVDGSVENIDSSRNSSIYVSGRVQKIGSPSGRGKGTRLGNSVIVSGEGVAEIVQADLDGTFVVFTPEYDGDNPNVVITEESQLKGWSPLEMAARIEMLCCELQTSTTQRLSQLEPQLEELMHQLANIQAGIQDIEDNMRSFTRRLNTITLYLPRLK